MSTDTITRPAQTTPTHRAGRFEELSATVPGGAVWGVLRLAMGWTFLWAFLDKLFGLGFATERSASWLNGGSPTEGFLANGLHTKGFLVDFYSGLAGQAWVDWIYMASMLLIGAALMLGVFTRLAAAAGVLWMLLFYTASAVWPENNPFLDEHLVYVVLLVGIAVVGAGRFLGLGERWERMGFVRRNPILR